MWGGGGGGCMSERGDWGGMERTNALTEWKLWFMVLGFMSLFVCKRGKYTLRL